jgi:hypothetical protein
MTRCQYNASGVSEGFVVHLLDKDSIDPGSIIFDQVQHPDFFNRTILVMETSDEIVWFSPTMACSREQLEDIALRPFLRERAFMLENSRKPTKDNTFQRLVFNAIPEDLELRLWMMVTPLPWYCIEKRNLARYKMGRKHPKLSLVSQSLGLVKTMSKDLCEKGEHAICLETFVGKHAEVKEEHATPGTILRLTAALRGPSYLQSQLESTDIVLDRPCIVFENRDGWLRIYPMTSFAGRSLGQMPKYKSKGNEFLAVQGDQMVAHPPTPLLALALGSPQFRIGHYISVRKSFWIERHHLEHWSVVPIRLAEGELLRLEGHRWKSGLNQYPDPPLFPPGGLPQETRGAPLPPRMAPPPPLVAPSRAPRVVPPPPQVAPLPPRWAPPPLRQSSFASLSSINSEEEASGTGRKLNPAAPKFVPGR